MQALERYSGMRCALVDRISRRPVIFIFRRPRAATIDVADDAVVAVNIEAAVAATGRNTAVVAASEEIAAVVVAVETTVAAASDSPCRHAYRWLQYTGLYRCYDLHAPRFPLTDRSKS